MKLIIAQNRLLRHRDLPIPAHDQRTTVPNLQLYLASSHTRVLEVVITRHQAGLAELLPIYVHDRDEARFALGHEDNA